MYKKVHGFTLIEILVVVFIITLLSAISIGYYTEQQKISRDASRKSDLIKISGALKNYFSVKKVYPLSSLHITTSPDAVGNCFYFSYGGAYRFENVATSKFCSDANTSEPLSNLVNNTYYKNWIPELKPNYMSSLPLDPKFKANQFSEISKLNGCFEQLVSKDRPTNDHHSNYNGCGENFWAYFYTSRLQKLEDTTSFKPQKFYILGTALENTDDKSTIGITKQKIFNLDSTYNSNNRILNSINPAYTHGMPDNLYIITSE